MDNDNSSLTTRLLWNLAGYKKTIIQTCKVDSYHATIIGVLLLMVGIYAVLAWTFFFSAVFENPIYSIVAGLFMGAFIVSFDRALIASLSSGNASPVSLGFRLILAILLGIFLSQPMVLKLYGPEIKREAQILVDKKTLERKVELENLYKTELDNLRLIKTNLETQIQNKKADFDKSKADFKAEMDGSGGTARYGYNSVAKKKEGLMSADSTDYYTLRHNLDPQIANTQRKIDSTIDLVSGKMDVYKNENSQFGTLVQAEALESLLEKDKSHALRNRYYLLAVILTLVELSALIAKLFFRSKSYANKVNFITEEETKALEVEKEIMVGRLEQYKQLALENEKQSVQDFFAKSKSTSHIKMGELQDEWKNSKDINFKSAWSKFKERLSIQG